MTVLNPLKSFHAEDGDQLLFIFSENTGGIGFKLQHKIFQLDITKNCLLQF